ncbi:hypothetical protein AX769_04965 [Frondihabitans sp. PAMC 28766]|nr:hypothetical protein AX769_04965 [Frondihabitans sp. PAMC 28766]
MNEVSKNQLALIREGITFGERVFGRSVSDQELSDAIVALVHSELIPVADWAVRGTPVDGLAPDSDDPLLQIAAQFILHVMSEGRSESLKALEQIARGSLLAGVLWSVDVDAPNRRIEGLELHLDTTLLLRLLGLCGPARQSFSKELTQLAVESGISLVCFEHTKREVVGVLSAAASILGQGRRDYYGEAVEYMVTEGWGPSDAEEVIASLPERLLDCGVVLRHRPDRDPKFNMDEDALADLLNSKIHYTNKQAQRTDVDSFASIFILRKGRHYDRFEASRALFVTTNSNLALAARQLYKVGEDDMRGVPLALVESQVATYLWARHTDRGDLPLDLLGIGAMSVAEGDPKVWLKFVEKIEFLHSRERLVDRDYVTLRQSLLARSLLLAKTDGNVDAFTEDTAEFVLSHAQREHSRELQEEISKRDDDLARARQDLAASAVRASRTEASLRGELAARTDAYASVALRRAKAIVLVVGIGVSVLLLISAVVSFPWPVDPPLATVLPWWISLGVGLVAVALGVSALISGVTVKGLGAWAVTSLARRLEERYKARFAPTSPRDVSVKDEL